MNLCIKDDWCFWMSSLHSVIRLENFFFILFLEYLPRYLKIPFANRFVRWLLAMKQFIPFLTSDRHGGKKVTKTQSNQTQYEANKCKCAFRNFYSVILLFTFYELILRTLGSHNNHQRYNLNLEVQVRDMKPESIQIVLRVGMRSCSDVVCGVVVS
jgi:hypothetical protein